MSDTPEIAAIRARWQAATRGPWIDLTASYFARMEDYRKRTGKWWHGTRLDSLPVVLIAQAQHHGEPLNVEHIPERVDYWDLNKVIAWRWGMLPMRTKEISEGFFSPEDAAAIAAAPADIATLLAALDEAQAREAGLTADVQSYQTEVVQPMVDQIARDAPVLAAARDVILNWELLGRGVTRDGLVLMCERLARAMAASDAPTPPP